MSSEIDGQQARSHATQIALMDAAEKLIAEHGIRNVSIKNIVREAGQKNESALQYHFKNLQGLIDAIHSRRNTQVRAKRAEALAQLRQKPSLRDLCRVMVGPTVSLASSDANFHRYIIAFSHEVALAEDSALDKVQQSGGGGQSGLQTGALLRAALPHLDEQDYRQRMEFAIRMISVSLGQHAAKKGAFHGKKSELFLSRLMDAMEGVLAAPVSDETSRLK